MFKPTKLKSLATVAGACVAIFSAPSANAFVYALSHLEVERFTLNIAPTLATTVNGYTFNLTNQATLLGGPTAANNAGCALSGPACGLSPVLDASMANAIGSLPFRSENDFSFLGTGHPNSYSGSDSIIYDAELVNRRDTALNQIAESLLNTNGQAQASALIQSNTSLTIDFTVSGGGAATLDLGFWADPDQRAEISGALGSYLAQSDLSATITLTRSGVGSGLSRSVSWAPRGTGSINDCNVGSALVSLGLACAETFDSESLNANVSASDNPEASENSFETARTFGRFGLHMTGLTAGRYTIALATGTSTSITRDVPEPGSLALIGVALLGLAFGASKRQSKQG